MGPLLVGVDANNASDNFNREKGEDSMIKKIDHIGIVVGKLDEAINMYKRAYGLKPIKIETIEEAHLKIAFIPLGDVLIELLQPTEPGAGRIGKFLEEKGEGLHHIALRVGDIDHTMEKLKESMVFRDKEPRVGADKSRIAFIEPEFTQNVLTELVERKQEVSEKASG
jgi:methylmalonyl-CoA/ethylmalonyl-CoA epimerase